MSISKAMSKAMSVYVKETLILAVSTLANGNPSVGQSVTKKFVEQTKGTRKWKLWNGTKGKPNGPSYLELWPSVIWGVRGTPPSPKWPAWPPKKPLQLTLSLKALRGVNSDAI